MVRLKYLTVAAIILVALVGVAWALDGDDESEPVLVVGESVASDFDALARGAFEAFVLKTPGIRNCIGSLRLEARPELDDLASYDRDSATIYVRVPATAPSLRESLVHEFAHHVEAVCASHASLRPRFLAAQGHSADVVWFGGAWEERPSEQYAEAVVEVVLGARARNQLQVPLAPEAIAEVASWLSGGQPD